MEWRLVALLAARFTLSGWDNVRTICANGHHARGSNGHLVTPMHFSRPFQNHRNHIQAQQQPSLTVELHFGAGRVQLVLAHKRHRYMSLNLSTRTTRIGMDRAAKLN